MAARSPRTTSPATRALLVAVLVALVLLGAATATPWQLSLPEAVLPASPTDDPEPVRTPGPVGALEEQPTPDAFTVIAVVLAVAGALVILALLVLLGRRALARLAAPTEESGDTVPVGAGLAAETTAAIPLADLQDAVRRALRHVDDAASPHDAVVAAWVALEDAADTHGTTRDPAETPTEFTSRLLAATPAPAASVAQLRALYAEARFTRRPVAPDQVTRARDALRTVARALDAAAPPAPPTGGNHTR